MSCRVAKRREWTARLVLEAMSHQENAFVTLTFNEENYPKDGSVCVRDMQLWLKRLRELVGPFRYCVTGEYGEQTWRAHYHALLFGVSPSLEALNASWKFGWTQKGTVTLASAGYVAAYTIKKLTCKDDKKLQGRKPEFARYSLRPGLGHGALDMLEAVHYEQFGARWIAEHRDVLKQVRFGGKIYTIGRYLTAQLRERLGLPEIDPARIEAMVAESDVHSLPDLLSRDVNRIRGNRSLEWHMGLQRRMKVL